MEPHTPDWVKDAVFYQIFPDRFASHPDLPKPSNLQPWGAAPTFHGFQGGDLLGVADHLDYLLDLGVNAIYLNPIFQSASNHRYHTFDYYHVDPILGGNRAFAYLLEQAHRRGLRLILDGVFNHVGRGFFQFNHLLECGQESPYVDWFQVYHWPVRAYNSHKPDYAAWWGNPALPKLNTANQAVREFIWDVATHWLERGADGWRLDVPNEIDDDAFWQEFRRRCKEVNPEAYLVGELWHEAGRWLQGDQFDGQMNYMFARAAYGFFGGERLNQAESGRSGLGYMPALKAEQVAQEFDRLSNHLYHPEIVQSQMTMLGSHDTPRLIHTAGGDVDTVRLMFLCQMTMPGAPNIYYGDEIGLPGGHDPDCRRAFPWGDEASWNQELRQDVARFVALRRRLPALRRGGFRWLYARDQVLVYSRHLPDQVVVVAFNAGTTAACITLPPLKGQELPPLYEQLGAAPGPPTHAGQRLSLPPRSGRVWAG